MKIEVPSRLAMYLCCGVDFLIDGAWTSDKLCTGIDLSTGVATVYRDNPASFDVMTETLLVPYRVRFFQQSHDDPELLEFVANAVDLGCEWDPDTMTLSGPGRRAA